MNLRFIWKLVKIIAVILLSVIAIVTFCLCVFLVGYYYDFKSYVPQMQTMIQNSPPLYRDPPPVFLHAMAVTNSKDSIRNWVTQIMILELKGPHLPAYKWQFHGFMWSHLLEIEFTDRELLALWCLHIYYKGGYGVSDAAYRHFGRDIDRLSPKEMITLLVLPNQPSYYIDNPEALRKIVERHLAEYHARYGSVTVCPDNTLDCAVENFRQLYYSDYERFFAIFHKAEEAAVSCTSPQKTADFLKVARVIEGNAEFGEYFNKVIEEQLVKKNPKCLLDALLLLDIETRDSFFQRLRHPVFNEKQAIDGILTTFRETPDYQQILTQYFTGP